MPGPLNHPSLGLLEWRDDLSEWAAEVALGPDAVVRLSLSPTCDDGSDPPDGPPGEVALAAAGADYLAWLRANELAVREQVADGLLADWQPHEGEPPEREG